MKFLSKKQLQAHPDFQFADEKMRSFVGKTIKVKYDGKEFEGKVDDVFLAGPHNSGFVIENKDGEWKHIKLYRLQELKEV